MKCLINPMDGSMKRVDEVEAKRLASYGWRYASKEQYKTWQVRKAFPNIAGLKQGLRRV